LEVGWAHVGRCRYWRLGVIDGGLGWDFIRWGDGILVYMNVAGFRICFDILLFFATFAEFDYPNGGFL